MSHSTPGQAYAYTPPAPADYYYEQPRDFGGDFAEGEPLCEGSPRMLVPPNVTEIYRRKSMAQHFRQNVYAPSSYYYEAVPQVTQQVRRPASYRHPMDGRAYFYSATGEEDYRPVVYDSAQMEGMAKSPRGVPVARQVVRRQHPVTVRTPKYYRKPGIYKRPSALCLPLASQPDPAICRRVKKSPDEPSYTPSQPIQSQDGEQSKPIARRHSLPDATNNSQEQAHRVDHSGDAQANQVDVDSLLAQYENILGNTVKKSASTSSKIANRIPSKHSILSMKPKVPPSLKGKQSVFDACGDQDEHAKEERIEVEEITTEILDSMLSELIESGCENKLEDADAKAENPRKRSLFSEKNLARPQSAMPKLEVSTSFNYQDLSRNFSKSQHELLTDAPTNSTPTDSPRGEFAKDPKQPAEEEHVCSENCRTAEEHSAIELHRSKSYIVNLIDRALSKELGTVPDERMASAPSCGVSASHPNEKERLRARKAIDLINKNIDKMDQGLCLEITQAITDSILSKATSPCVHSTKHCACTCPVQEEPLYVKQLKQLRWGHLKHIQREVRRLEDLEKFLDSCTSGTQ